MKVVVLNGSPKGNNSITLYTVKFIQKHFPNCTFEVLNVGQSIKKFEKDFAPCRQALESAQLIIFSYPVYTFLVPAQLHRFIELMKQSGIDFSSKIATQISTSKHFYDVTAHRFIEENCADMSLNYIKGLSADMEDLLSEKGRKEAIDFFKYVLYCCKNSLFEPSHSLKAKPVLKSVKVSQSKVFSPKRKSGKVVIVADYSESEKPLSDLIGRFKDAMEYECETVNLRDFRFSGGCLGCFKCAADGKCIYKDNFDEFLRTNIQCADAIVYAFSIKDHSMGYRFKLFDDRQFCNGHRTVTMGHPVAYIIDGNLENEPNLRTLIEARAQVGGNFLAGTATSPEQVNETAARLSYAIKNNYQPPQDFYGVGGLKIFRDLIFQMQGLMREDHKFYKEHGFYDFPQKQMPKIAAMYAVGAMMNNEKLMGKIGSKMNEGMTMPYESVLKKY